MTRESRVQDLDRWGLGDLAEGFVGGGQGRVVPQPLAQSLDRCQECRIRGVLFECLLAGFIRGFRRVEPVFLDPGHGRQIPG